MHDFKNPNEILLLSESSQDPSPRRFYCRTCGETFALKLQLTQHTLVCHQQRQDCESSNLLKYAKEISEPTELVECKASCRVAGADKGQPTEDAEE